MASLFRPGSFVHYLSVACIQTHQCLMCVFICVCLREADVTLKDFYQYEDNQVGDLDAFAREPFILRFSCPSTGMCYILYVSISIMHF